MHGGTAEQHGIHVVLATLLPTGEQDPDKLSAAHIAGQDDSVSGHNRIMFGHDQIQTLNNWLKNSANQKHYTLVDDHFALADDRGYLKKDSPPTESILPLRPTNAWNPCSATRFNPQCAIADETPTTTRGRLVGIRFE
jgi:hypothetical protein